MIALYFSLFLAALGFVCAYFQITSAVLGFYMMLLALPLAIGSMLPILVPFFRRRRLFRSSWHRLIAGIIALGVLGYLGYLSYLHPLNDLSTDPNNPPKFEHPVYRIQVKAGVENLGPEFLLDRSWNGNAQKQAEKYKEISPLVVKVPPQLLATLIFNTLAKFPDWKLVHENKARYRAELETRSPILHFVDDIVVEGRPIDSLSSQVVVRSRSRVGKSDLGANAKRIIDFSYQLRALAAEYEMKAKSSQAFVAPAKPAVAVPAASGKPKAKTLPAPKGKTQ